MRQKLLISDASVLIDAIAGGILDLIFRLPYEFGVPDVLFHDELEERHPELPGKGLKVLELQETAIGDTAALHAAYGKTGVSVNDCMALALARHEHCPLLTGDRALRRIANSEGIEVRGTLWLVEALFEAGHLTLDEVEKTYAAMRADGSRLPWDEVERQVRRLSRK